MFTLTITKRDGSETEVLTFKTERAAELALLSEKGWESAKMLIIRDPKGFPLLWEHGDFVVEEDGIDD